jgi:RNA polymerase sigma-70 factor (ECF subfamily)
MAQLAIRRHPLAAGLPGAGAVRPRCDAESRGWLHALSGTAPERAAAVARLHALLLRAARFEIARRRPAAGARRSELDELAVRAADAALTTILRGLHAYGGDSRFTTWASKFAIREAAATMRERSR